MPTELVVENLMADGHIPICSKCMKQYLPTYIPDTTEKSGWCHSPLSWFIHPATCQWYCFSCIYEGQADALSLVFWNPDERGIVSVMLEFMEKRNAAAKEMERAETPA